jgi:hypothetical protein
VLGLFTPQRILQTEWPLHVPEQLEGIFVYLLIIATLPAKTQHVVYSFSTALALKMEATRNFEASGAAPNPTRTEPSARNTNTPERT